MKHSVYQLCSFSSLFLLNNLAPSSLLIWPLSRLVHDLIWLCGPLSLIIAIFMTISLTRIWSTMESSRHTCEGTDSSVPENYLWDTIKQWGEGHPEAIHFSWQFLASLVCKHLYLLRFHDGKSCMLPRRQHLEVLSLASDSRNLSVSSSKVSPETLRERFKYFI